MPKQKITVMYSENGFPVSDFKTTETFFHHLNIAKTFGDEQKIVFDYSTFNMIQEWRLAYVRGDVALEDFEFEFNHRVVPMNEYAAIPDWVEGFGTQGGDAVEQILDGASKRRQKKLEEHNKP